MGVIQLPVESIDRLASSEEVAASPDPVQTTQSANDVSKARPVEEQDRATQAIDSIAATRPTVSAGVHHSSKEGTA